MITKAPGAGVLEEMDLDMGAPPSVARQGVLVYVYVPPL